MVVNLAVCAGSERLGFRCNGFCVHLNGFSILPCKAKEWDTAAINRPGTLLIYEPLGAERHLTALS